MATRGIIFNTEMVKAILDRRKTQTRRIVKSNHWPVPIADGFEWCLHETKDGRWEVGALNKGTGEGSFHSYINCPYGKPGDIIWVRETFLAVGGLDCPNPRIIYRASDHDWVSPAWQSSTQLPEKYARLFLKIKDIRVERVQDITGEDAKSEGVAGSDRKGVPYGNCKIAFMALWDKINYKRGFGWSVNPWCWVMEFERTENAQ